MTHGELKLHKDTEVVIIFPFSGSLEGTAHWLSDHLSWNPYSHQRSEQNMKKVFWFGQTLVLTPDISFSLNLTKMHFLPLAYKNELQKHHPKGKIKTDSKNCILVVKGKSAIINVTKVLISPSFLNDICSRYRI